MSDNDIITLPVRDFTRRTGIRRSQTYVLLDQGLLQSANVKGTRLIIMSSYDRLLERNRVPPRHKARGIV